MAVGPETAKSVIRRRLVASGSAGGYVFAASQSLPPQRR
jgi:hypothetical protein